MTTRIKPRPPTNVRFEVVNGTVIRTCDDEGVFDNGTDLGRYLARVAIHKGERHQRADEGSHDGFVADDPIEVDDEDLADYRATCAAWEEG